MQWVGGVVAAAWRWFWGDVGCEVCVGGAGKVWGQCAAALQRCEGDVEGSGAAALLLFRANVGSAKAACRGVRVELRQFWEHCEGSVQLAWLWGESSVAVSTGAA